MMKHLKWFAPLTLAAALSSAQAQTWTKLNLGIARNVTPNQIGVDIGTTAQSFMPIGTILNGAFSANMLFQQGGTGAAVRSANDKLKEFYVTPQDFNPTAGTGGDDSAAIQAAVTAVLASGNGTVYFAKPPSGAYNICSANIYVSAYGLSK